MPWLLSPYFFYGYSICLNSQNCPTLLMKRSKIVHQRFCVYHLGEKYLVSTCFYEVILCLGQPCECRQIHNQLDLLDWTTSAADWYRNLNTFSFREKNQLHCTVSRIFAKIQPRNYRFSGISNPQKCLQYLFSLLRC